MINTKALHERKSFLENRIAETRRALAGLPEGTLSIGDRHGHPHYYVCGIKDKDGRPVKKYIPASKEAFAADLAQKAYLQEQLRCDLLQFKALERFLRDYEKGSVNEAKFKHSEHFFDLLRKTKRISPDVEECQHKLDAMFRSSTKRPEGRRFPTRSGIKVRSKSEVEIANLLYSLNIPFTYEPVIEEDGFEITPDFIFMPPSTCKLCMWEHFGMMDNPDYAKTSLRKLEALFENGWLLGQNLIVTTETYDSPFYAEKAAYALGQVIPL